MNGKKCIIIGSGLGGLSCGVILARNGYDVTVLEQHSQIGGCLQCFSRKGAKFETGMHFIGSAAPGQTLHKLMRYLKLDDIQLSQLDPLGYDVISLCGQRFKFANGREPFIDGMGQYFPNEKDNLANYYDIIQKIAHASSLHSLRQTENDIILNTFYQTISVNEVLDDLFQDRLLREVLVGNIPLYAGEKDKTPFSQHAFITDFYNQSAFRIIGGSDNIASSMANTIHKFGGQVTTKSKVTKIFCNDSKAIGVEINDEKFLPADIIISDIHPARIMEMLDTKLIRPAFRNRISHLTNTTAGFSVYLKFKDETVPYMNSNFYGFNSGSPWGCENYTETTWPKGYLYMHFCNQVNPQYATSGVILSYMNIKDVEQWQGTTIGHRGASYELFKKQKAEILINELNKEFPGFRNSIDSHYTSSPLTYSDYTGTQDGSMYGIVKDITLGPAGRVPHKTKVPNLFFAGQNINSHGMLGVLIGSIVTCSELLTAGAIYQQIIQSNK